MAPSTNNQRNVVFVDGIRTPFGKAGPKGMYADTRADDLVVKAIRELLRRNPQLDPARIDEVAVAATTQTGDQGLTIGRTAAILAGLPETVPGFAIDRMCAGAMTAVTTTASGIGFGQYDVVIAGGVEHMGHHPMGEGADPNPRFLADRLVDPSALVMGNTAENLHDRFPTITKDRTDAYAVNSQNKYDAAKKAGFIADTLVPVATRSSAGWGLATEDEPPRPGTTVEDLAKLKTPFRPAGRITAGNAAGLNDGATAALLAGEDTAAELGLPVGMRMVGFAYQGVDPAVMGIGPVPATEKLLARTGLKIEDIGLFEINEGVRRSGPRVPRALRNRRRRPARQPVGRRHRVWAPSRFLGRSPDDAALPPVRDASRRALRLDHHVHRPRHGAGTVIWENPNHAGLPGRS